ncbi:MAG: cardiolipin synthase ClsB [Betaproteobacteria bacterium]|jgi:cardiolipin synthase|nr:cardiolipin synthase ClsB [Betaproteobacteria bacterium]
MSVVFREGNRVTLLRSGVEYFPALEAAIEQAQYSIHLETYIFADDAAGRRIAGALLAAAARGVRTDVIVDGFGSKRFLGTLSDVLAAGEVRVLVFRSDIYPWNFGRHGLRRMHRKLAVIDGTVAFVGGINIIDDMHTPGHTPPRFDYAVRVEGPVLENVCEQAEQLWTLTAWANLRQEWALEQIPRPVPSWAPQGFQRAAFLVRDNFRHRSDIEDAYLEAIEAAEQEILIASAYFFPGRRFRRALTQAAARGVRVVLLLQGRVEYVLLHYASRALYGALLDAGVEIQEYTRSFLHAKVAVVDGEWATVGSSNIDPFSLLLGRECNVVADDRRFAQELRESLGRAMADGAEPVVRQRWRRQPLVRRVKIWIAYGIARFLMGMFGYGRML